MHGKCARIKLSQAASGMILQNHRRLPVSIFSGKIAALGSLKRSGLLEGFSKLFSIFKGASNYVTNKKLKNYQRLYIKYLFNIIKKILID
jgi:hypothetical protein